MATGQEMAMNAVFRWLGVDPEETKQTVVGAVQKVLSFDARLTALETAVASQNDLLALILKHTSGEKTNGTINTADAEHGPGDGRE